MMNVPKIPLMLRSTVLTTALCIAGFSTTAQASDGGGWDWMVAPYLWAVSVGADLSTSHPPDVNVSSDRTFNSILDDLDGAFQVHIEGRGDHVGLFTDFTYLGLADSHAFTHFNTSSDLDSRLFELAAFWHPGDDRNQGFEVFGGLRYIDVDLTVNFVPNGTILQPTNFKDNDDFSDFMLGVRYTWALSDRWELTARGDGSYGQTDGTWNASLVGAYKMEHGAWLFGYRYLAADLPTRRSDIEIDLQGPMIGYGFMF